MGYNAACVRDVSWILAVVAAAAAAVVVVVVSVVNAHGVYIRLVTV